MQMQRFHSHLALSLILAAAAACAVDSPTAARTSDRALARATTCPKPTVVVSDEASLRAAAAAAQPGDVIGVHGTIRVTAVVELTTPDVTITCAEPGAGLAFLTPDDALLYLEADRISVLGLQLDATGGNWAFTSLVNDGQVSKNNTIVCGAAGCAFWVSSTNAIVADNVATSHGSQSGFHFQSGIDGTRIERNTIIAAAPAGIATFGGMRPRDGANVTITGNVITGPWSNSISSVNLNDSELSHNTLDGAQRYALAVNIVGNPQVIFSRGDRLVSNKVRNAGVAAFGVRNACTNSFLGNDIEGTAVGFELDPSTGDNHIAGSSGTVVDAGAFDCDGDGSPDPNKVTGNATVVGPSTIAAIVSGSASLMSENGGSFAHSKSPALR